jgi:hypothetical protein
MWGGTNFYSRYLFSEVFTAPLFSILNKKWREINLIFIHIPKLREWLQKLEEFRQMGLPVTYHPHPLDFYFCTCHKVT